MVAELQLALLGKLQIKRAGQPVSGFVSSKVQALLCYLAVTGRPHDREMLATLLWGEMPETEAKANLRTALFNLRKLVGDHLTVTRQTVAFDRGSPYGLDVELFLAWIAAGIGDSKISTQAGTPEVLLPPLRQAIELYQGDFLEGFTVRDAPVFEAWLYSQRERFRQLAVQALHTLAVQHTHRGEYAAGIDYTTRLLALESWREEAHRQMMILLARSGQRSAALAQYDACCRILADELGVEPMAETTTLYERLKAAGTTCPHNLPPQPTLFIGREAELVQISINLENAACRLLTLVGPGGIGKTRLALESATQQMQRATFQDGVFWLNLTSVTSVTLLMSGLAGALNLTQEVATEFKSPLFDYLHSREVLWVLDNFEHLLDPSDDESGGISSLLVEMLQAAPKVKIIVTSRERLNLREEWVIEVGGLAYPSSEAEKPGRGGDNQLAVSHLQAYSALTLFIQCAQQTQADFELSEANLVDVARICRLVEGVPLGLELAASWLQLYSCSEIAQEIERSLDFLTTSLRNVPARHRSLRAVFEHSWNLLTSQEQAVFRQLSVFRGGFSREAALAITQTSPFILAKLLNKSLLYHTASGRYEIHELLRQYAAEKLANLPDEQEVVRERHALYFADFLQQWQQQFEQNKSSEILATLTAETKNIRLGRAWALESGQVSAEIIHQYWYLGHIGAATHLYQPDLSSFQPPDPSWDQGLELHTQGVLAYRQGRYQKAKRCLIESLSLLEAAEDALYKARSKVILGLIAYDLGQTAEAELLLGESETALKADGEHRYRSYALAYLGRIAQAAGRPVTVEPLLRESLAVSRDIEDKPAMAYALQNLGSLLNLTGRPLQAKLLLEESLALCREMEEAWSSVVTLIYLGQTYTALGDCQTAKSLYDEALELATALHFQPLAVESVVGLAHYESCSDPSAPERQSRAVSLITLALNQPACSQPTRLKAGKLLAELEAALSPETFAAAQAQATSWSLEAVTEMLVSGAAYDALPG